MSDFKNISVTELQQMLATGGYCLVDVRGEAEVARGYIQGAKILPLSALPLRLNELNVDAPTVFYCQMGGRSAQAASFAIGRGFVEVYNLQGGIAAWLQADAAVVLP
jgi:rhodanese-related sulfurtransferase